MLQVCELCGLAKPFPSLPRQQKWTESVHSLASLIPALWARVSLLTQAPLPPLPLNLKRAPWILASFGNFTHCQRSLWKPPFVGSFARALDETYLSCAERLNVFSELFSERDEGLRNVFREWRLQGAGLYVIILVPVDSSSYWLLYIKSVSVTAVQGAVQQYLLKHQIQELNGCFLLGSRL